MSDSGNSSTRTGGQQQQQQGTLTVEATWKDKNFLSFVPTEDAEDHSDGDRISRDAHQPRGTTSPTNPTTGSRCVVDQEKRESLPPWMDQPYPNRISPLVGLHNEIVDFCKLMEPLPEEIKQREQLIEQIKTLVYSIFGSDACQVHLFGSQATSLFLPSSDIDLVIDLHTKDNNTNNNSSTNNGDPTKVLFQPTDPKGTDPALANAVNTKSNERKEMEEWDIHAPTGHASPLIQLANGLKEKWRDELSYLEVIENTRVPLVKFTHGPTDISVDICFNQETGPKAADLMKTYMNAMPPLRPLTFVLKYFMEARGINEPYSGGIGSYMLQLMIVSFLQHRERDGYNFNRPCLANLACLLIEFFELYGMDFNYVTTGISVRHDGFYFCKGAKERKEHFWQPSRPFSLAMENPLEPTADVGKPSFRMQMIQRSFEVAFKVLLAHVSDPMVPSVSILANILPPTPEMKKRAVLKQGNNAVASSCTKSQRSTDTSLSAERGAGGSPRKKRGKKR